MIQLTAWLLTLALVIPITALFLFVALARKPADDTERLVTTSYRLRRWAFWAIVVGVTPVMLYTLTVLPYDAEEQAAYEAQTVDVIGHMWHWEVSEIEVQAGEPVHFRVTSADVNHGLGIYDEEGRLLTQTQAMPGYTNVLKHTFEEPGTYELLCLEYCGVAHHQMISELTVTP